MPRPIPDEEQLPATTSKAGLTYVQAAPGSGKTFLTVERFGWLRYHALHSEQRGVAAVSFARSASSELRTRISRRWGGSALSWPAFAGTFDELLRIILRDLLAREVLIWPGGHMSLAVHDSWRRFPKTKQQGKHDVPLRAVADVGGNVLPVPLGRWPKAKPYFVDSTAYADCLAEGHATHDEIRSVLASVLGIGDVADLDLSDEVGRFLSENFAHLLVDEAFDLNALDAEVLKVAARSGVELTLVGDPWQSIFEFRGAVPKAVESFIEEMNFSPFEVVSSHRYKSHAMQDLARRLVRGDWFEVEAAEAARVPDVVLADRWLALWECGLRVLPCGLGRVDRTTGSAALLVLLNDLTMELFGEPAADISNAIASLDWSGDRRDLSAARSALADPSVEVGDVWAALRKGPASAVGWQAAGAEAGRRLDRLVRLLRSGGELRPGLTVHQSKGLQWPNVDYLTSLHPGAQRRLDRDKVGDRLMYVALTRAELSVRVRELPDRVKTQMYFEGVE